MPAPLVSICTLTYHHEPYIRDAIDSFFRQQTTFPFEIVTHDDGSTDATQRIVNEYALEHPGMIRSIVQPVNLYSQGVRGILARFLLPHATGKYVALCEGDDYWTDPRKLQIQIDFLETHPEFAGSFHETQQLNEDGTPGRVMGEAAPGLMTAADTFAMYSPFHTSSFVFRRDIGPMPAWIGEVVSADMALFSIVAAKGALWKAPGRMSVYRKTAHGITSLATTTDRFHEQRIALMQKLNDFHGGRFAANARKVIAQHERAIAKAHRP